MNDLPFTRKSMPLDMVGLKAALGADYKFFASS